MSVSRGLLALVIVTALASPAAAQIYSWRDVDGKLVLSDRFVSSTLAYQLGGEFMLGIISAIAFATILAVVAGLTITASACVARAPRSDDILVLTPCGICQERLFHWGDQVEVAVPDPADPTRWMTKTLREIQPYYWVNVFK